MTDDPEPVFLDTNILVYAFDNSAGHKHDLASKLVRMCWEEQNGHISVQVLQEFYVSVTRKIPSPMNAPDAKQIIADLAQWRHHTPETSDLLRAIDLQAQYQLSFWDAMIVQSSLSLGCKQLLSEDLSHNQRFGKLQVINPFRE